MDHPPCEQSGRTDRHLVLVGGTREHPGQLTERPLVRLLGQVDQSTPELRLLQCDDPADSPQLGLHRIRRGVGRSGAHGTAGGAPQRRPEAEVGQRLD